MHKPVTAALAIRSKPGPRVSAKDLLTLLNVSRTPFPGFTQPMLATLTEERFTRAGWIFEQKLDGERCLAASHNGHVTLWTRNQKQINGAYPEIVEALKEQASNDFIIDGEIVALGGLGSAFGRLQHRMHRIEHDPESGIVVAFYLFDILWLDGFDLTSVPLIHRKSVLKEAIGFGKVLRFTPHRARFGQRYYAKACRDGWEGLIAKRAEGVYQHGRSRDWLKFKCTKEQEFVIIGYTDPQGERESLGALLLGYYAGAKLHYAGKVGTGFDQRLLSFLFGKLSPLQVGKTPTIDPPAEKRGVHWVKPRMVGQVSFTEWTGEGHLRHPVFQGLRDDKEPREVTREGP